MTIVKLEFIYILFLHNRILFNRYLYHPRTQHVWINVTRGRTNIYLSDLNKLKVCVHQNVRKATPNHNISRDLWHKQYTRDTKMRQPQILKMKNNTLDMRIYWFKLISPYKLKNRIKMFACYQFTCKSILYWYRYFSKFLLHLLDITLGNENFTFL